MSQTEKERIMSKIEVDDVGKVGSFKAFMMLFKGFVGTAILFLPNGFYNGGWLFSTLVLTFSGFLTGICITKLIDTRKAAGGGSYSQLGVKAYGARGKILVDISVACSQVLFQINLQIGFVIAYVVFVSQNLQYIVGNIFNLKEPINIWWFGKNIQ
jgi:proton-coupled amino acid transporter